MFASAPVSRAASRLLLAAALIFGVSGCAGYRLGPTLDVPAGERSIYVEVFTNDTLQPRLEDAVTRAVRQGLQREGTFRLANRSDCDLIVRGVITDYTRRGVSYQPDDLATVRDYSLVLTAHVTLQDRDTGAVILDQSVSGVTQARAGDDLASAERQATPLLAENLARRITDLITDGTW